MVVKFDANVERKVGIISSSVGQLESQFLPSIIEFSSSGLCNRKCIFCPRSAPDYNHVNSHLSLDKISKLSSELKQQQNFKYYFLFSGFSEPLLTPHLGELINILKSDHPNSTIEINTNTDLLNPKVIESLFSKGLTSFICSIYDSRERLEEVRQMFHSLGYEEPSFKLRERFLIKQNDGENALDEFGITLSNRGGAMANAKYSIQPTLEPLHSKCYYPFYNMFVDYNGDYLLCPHDWNKGEILGNIDTHECLSEVWQSDRLNKIRKDLLDAKRHTSAPCSVCDVNGTLMGYDQSVAWELWMNEKMC